MMASESFDYMQDSPVLMSPPGGVDEETSDAVTSPATAATVVRDRFAEIWIWSDDVIGYINFEARMHVAARRMQTVEACT